MEEVLALWQGPVLASGFLLLLAWESIHPFFRQTGRLVHAVRNLVLAGLNGVAAVFVFSALTAAVSGYVAAHGFGLLHRLPLSDYAALALSLVALDAWTYFWHRVNHRIPLLWRFHRVHHSDENMDVTTATRFHLGEIVISSAVRLLIALPLGLTAAAFLLYDLVLVAVTQFHHANVGLTASADRAIRYAIVTPNMHRVHHSDQRPETDSNFASILSLWDRLFGTYREKHDYRAIRFGLKELRGEPYQTIRGMLLTPFINAPTGES